MSASLDLVPQRMVRVRAPGKVNLSLRVGRVREDGYHPLATAFQAVRLSEEVRVSVGPQGSGVRLRVWGDHSEGVPTDESNLAWKAAMALSEATGIAADVDIEVVKGIPVAGGMAGGSADAAATLVACDVLWDLGMPRSELAALAAGLGADVPFGLLGHTAMGTGRGDVLSPMLTRGEYHWVFGVSRTGLSTAAVFSRFDELVGGPENVDPAADSALLQALRAGDAAAVGGALHNDLEPVALDLRPELADVLRVAREEGALGVIVSGSGPTVAALASDRGHGLAIADAWRRTRVCDEAYCTTGPAKGAHLVD